MPWTYQSTLTNPAIRQEARFQLMLPVPVPTVGLDVYHSGFRVKDLVSNPEESAWRLDPYLALERMPETGVFRGRTEALLLGTAFHLGPWQLGFHVSNHSEFLLAYPKNLFRLALNGNAAYLDQTLDLTPRLNATNYHQYALSLARNIGKKWRVGARIKLLGGVAHLSSAPTGNEISLLTQSEAYQIELQTKYTFMASSSLGLGVENLVDLVQGQGQFTPTGWAGLSNPGYAFDLGVQYEPIANLQLSASIIDLGRINWRQAAGSYQVERTLRFEGLDPIGAGWINLVDSNWQENFSAEFERFADSLGGSFGIEQQGERFETGLPARAYLSAQYRIFRFLSLGLAWTGEYYQRTQTQAISAWTGLHAGRWLTFGLNYTYDFRYQSMLGVHSRLNLGPMQFYGSLGNILPAISPMGTQSISLILGANYTFGRKKKKD